ncbi:hypothetical protein HT102_11510 [Hoyosella sp. G463]|uniref:Uncharacterized protein n=1 Tax=Lolliginicoccus lacisalsi TaxID=2742202 RepID=A0A927JD57_9ACTN|nr:hypothetical protein [Lolliginicoccus lacisalsi]MBD8507116.1 hypothetical protein [Lolliginicoccus lacisalsi]
MNPSIFDLSTVGEEQLGVAPSEIYAAIFDGLLSAAAFFQDLLPGIINIPGI